MIVTSTQTNISVVAKAPADWKTVVVFVTQGAKAADGASAAAAAGMDAATAAARLLSAGASKGKAREIVFDLLENQGNIRRVYVAGIGKDEKLTTENLRQSAAAVAKALARHQVNDATIILPGLKAISPAQVADALVSGLMLVGFDYQECKGTAAKKGDEEFKRALNVKLVAADDLKLVEAAARTSRIVADAQNFCRTIANRPGNVVYPAALAKIAVDMARQTKLKCTIFDEKKLAKLKMGGILAVGNGSIATPPRLIVLEHKPTKAHGKPLLLVGKAVTFDTGGISIKPADKMGKMIYDKCGGVTVLGLMYAAAELKLPLHIVGVIPSAENAVSSRAYRPGDVITMYNGVTVEVTNTDAEGRLILGDALAWGIEQYQPAAVIDLATLTGGVIVALGRQIAGMMCNNDALSAEILGSADNAGEKLWRLPLWEEQREQIKSDLADIMNSAGREAHPLQGGAFLSHFVPDDGSVPWAHLDIAGVADTEKDLPYYVKGATGWGVRTLVNWMTARSLSKPVTAR